MISARRTSHALFALSAIGYFVSMGLPATGDSDSLIGWQAAWTSAALCWNEAQECILSGRMADSATIGFAAGTTANALFLSAGLFGWKLRCTPLVLAGLCLGASLSALLVPPLLATFPLFSNPAITLDWRLLIGNYHEFGVGYWCWAGSTGTALLAAILACRRESEPRWRTGNR
jgi:hypothetical protein